VTIAPHTLPRELVQFEDLNMNVAFAGSENIHLANTCDNNFSDENLICQ
jgi:hypothetical protein